jgi:serine/tyrosine/threonine adenylyltransferase
MTDLERQLAFADRFVRELPGDPSVDPRPRQVQQACYSRTNPTPVAAPELVVLVPEVAALVGIDPQTSASELANVLGGNSLLPGMEPYAACYGGHQFGVWAGQLGDGRAITLGEVVAPDGEVLELQLKGAGPTPYSRRADGRAVLRSSLRELVCSEAMHHLGVPTTRALSLVTTGEPVLRDLLYDGHPEHEPGAVACRVAPSFLRFGSYEIHAARDDRATLERLVQFTIEHYYPHRRGDIVGWFDEVMRRTAWVVTEWMRVGFVHGVMNTDNMSILGLTIDYGPYGWIEPFDLDWTPNITDAGNRRYRFGHQLRVAQWNIAQLARALVPLCDAAALERVVAGFAAEADQQFHHMMLRKLGLTGRREHAAADQALLAGLGERLTAREIDMTLFFRALATDDPATAMREACYEPDDLVDRVAWRDWLDAYRARVALEDGPVRARMDAVNPLYVPRNYLVQQVIDATAGGDRRELLELLDVLRHPYTAQPGRERFAAKRPEWARVKPGCSMLSCSS